MNVGPLTFVEVEAGTTHVGDNRGGWIHASQRPRHEVRLPAFYILESPLSANEVAALLGREESGQNDVHEGVDAALVNLKAVLEIVVLLEQVRVIEHDLRRRDAQRDHGVVRFFRRRQIP